jgi:hypothetical protein
MENFKQEKSPITPLLAADVEDKPTEWFYPNVFVRGELNGIQGIPGDGKTWLMCELAAKTSVGGEVQGIEERQHGSVTNRQSSIPFGRRFAGKA